MLDTKIKSFESELSPCLYIFYVFGLQYFKINQISKIGRVSWYFLLIFFAWIFFLTIINAVTIITSVHRRLKSPTKDDIFLDIILFSVSIFECIINFSIVAITFFTSAIQKKIFRYFKEIFEISFLKLGHEIDYQSFRVKYFVKFFGVCGFIVIFSFASIVFDWYFDGKLHKILLKQIVMTVFSLLACVKFIFLCDLLQFHLDQALIIIKRMKEDHLRNPEDVPVHSAIKSLNFDLIRHDDLLDKLSGVKKIYSIVFKASRLIDICFRWINFEILAFILLVFLTTIFGIFSGIMRGVKAVNVLRERFKLKKLFK